MTVKQVVKYWPTAKTYAMWMGLPYPIVMRVEKPAPSLPWDNPYSDPIGDLRRAITAAYESGLL